MTARKWVHLKFLGHIAVMTGRVRQTVGLAGEATVGDLLVRLDQEYPGFREVFVPPGGVFNSRTGITCRRVGQPTFGIVEESAPLEDGDVLLLW